MGIADLFAASGLFKSVGTGRDGRDNQQRRGFAVSRPPKARSGHVGTTHTGDASCRYCPDRRAIQAGQEKAGDINAVPTVPTVPTTEYALATRCRHCGAAPQSLEIGGFSPAGWTCGNCLAAAGLLAIARSVLVEDDAGGPIVCMASSSRRLGRRRWHDDRAWIVDLTSAESPEAKLAVLGSWVAAAGGRLIGGRAELPSLPRRLATLELRRMLRQAGIEIRDAAASAGVSP